MKLPRARGYRSELRIAVVLLGAALLDWGTLTAKADTDAPLHDWTVRIHGGAYGFTSWAPGHWNMYVGRLVDPGASLTFHYIVTVSSMLLLGVGSCWLSIALMRTIPPLLPNALAQRMRHWRSRFRFAGQRTRNADSRR